MRNTTEVVREHLLALPSIDFDVATGAPYGAIFAGGEARLLATKGQHDHSYAEGEFRVLIGGKLLRVPAVAGIVVICWSSGPGHDHD